MEELKEFGIELGGAFYRVVTTDIDVYSSLYDTNDELKKESALMSFVVENISNEIVSDHNAGIAYRDSDSRVCMLLWSDNPKEFSQEIQVICREIQKTVKEAMQLSVSIGIGFCVEKLEDLFAIIAGIGGSFGNADGSLILFVILTINIFAPYSYIPS